MLVVNDELFCRTNVLLTYSQVCMKLSGMYRGNGFRYSPDECKKTSDEGSVGESNIANR